MQILALCGSLRAASINAAMLRAVQQLAPAGVEVHIFDNLGQLPLFSPDLERAMPGPVQRLHAAVAAADALLVASPEYAHGVTGTIKNALDWLVSFEPFVYKPVAVLNASPRAHHADVALRETLRTMSAVIVEEGSVAVPLLGQHRDTDSMLREAAVVQVLSKVLPALRGSTTR